RTTGLVEDDAQLLLADAVLLAQTLLLAQTDGVVAVELALGAPVLTRILRTLLEVLDRLGGQRDAEGAREADLAAILGLRGHGLPSHNMAATFTAHRRTAPPLRTGRTSTRPAELMGGVCSEVEPS